MSAKARVRPLAGCIAPSPYVGRPTSSAILLRRLEARRQSGQEPTSRFWKHSPLVGSEVINVLLKAGIMFRVYLQKVRYVEGTLLNLL